MWPFNGTANETRPPRGLLAFWNRVTGGRYPGPEVAASTPAPPVVELAPLDPMKPGLPANGNAQFARTLSQEIAGQKVLRGPAGVEIPAFLPWVDEFTSGTGETTAIRKVYRLMLANPEVKASLCNKLFSVAALDLKFHPARKKDPYQQKLADFCRWTFEEVLGGVPKLVQEILMPGLIDGHCITEKVIGAPEEKGRWRGKCPLEDLASIDVNHDAVLRLDDRKRVFDVMGLRYNAGRYFDPSLFVIWSHMPLFGLPTGVSDFRAAYASYWTADTASKLWLLALKMRAGGLLVGKWESSAESVRQSLQQALEMAVTNGWLMLPPGTSVDILDLAAGGPDVFEAAMRYHAHRIFLCIEGAMLQSLEGETPEGRGNTKIQKGTAELRSQWLARSLERVLNGWRNPVGLIRDVVDLNWLTDDYPKATLSAVDLEKSKAWGAVFQLAQQLGFSPSKTQIGEAMGVEEADPADPDDALTPPASATPMRGGGSGEPPPVTPDGLNGHGHGHAAAPPKPDETGLEAFAESFAEGRWVTMGAHGHEGERYGGTPVYIEDGKITKGPAHTVGKAPHELGQRVVKEHGPNHPETGTPEGPAPAKALHEITRCQYVGKGKEGRFTRGLEHSSAVYEALRAGKDVPERVLRDYPDIKDRIAEELAKERTKRQEVEEKAKQKPPPPRAVTPLTAEQEAEWDLAVAAGRLRFALETGIYRDRDMPRRVADAIGVAHAHEITGRLTAAFNSGDHGTVRKALDAAGPLPSSFAEHDVSGEARDAAGRWVGHVAEAVKTHGGPHNLAPMTKVRVHLHSAGLPDRAAQDAAIHAARVAGHVTGSNYEGRHSLTDPEHKAMLDALHKGKYGDERIGYLSTRTEFAEDPQGHEHRGKGPGGGQFAPKGQGDGGAGESVPQKSPAVKGAMAPARREGKGKEARLVMADGSPAPVHIKPSLVPPDWTDVKVATDPESDVLATARDNKGRPKIVYRDEFHMRNAAVKFVRTQAGLTERHALYAENRRNLNDPDPKVREAAACTWLMQEQATRPGSDKDTGGKVKAYGATTLLAEHVEETPEGVRLRFVGKEGVGHDHLIRDPELAAELVRRKETAGGRSGKLFDTTYERVSEYARSLDTGRFSPKDWRTIKANALAIDSIKSLPAPKSKKEYKAAVKAVAERVSGVLGNRPAQALESYIDPAVFSGWRVDADA